MQLDVLFGEFLKKFHKSSEKFLEYSKGFWLGKRGPLIKHRDKKGATKLLASLPLVKNVIKPVSILGGEVVLAMK